MLKKKTEKAKTELVNCQLKINESSLVRTDVNPFSDKISKTWQDGLEEELDEIKDRLAKELDEIKERLAKLEHKF